jgi:3-oxoacyl-[acyl-carrier protein] reductase
MELGLRGRVALVGGSSRGLGFAVARELAVEGCRVIVCARDAAAVEDARARIAHETGADAAGIAVDLSVPADVERVVALADEQFGAIDVLVTNTGGPPPGPFESHTALAWQAAITQLLESVVNLTRLVVPGMKQRGWGRIVNITSIAVKQPVEGLILSNSIRAAVTGFGRTLANELAPLGITVNNVMPGYTRTERLVHLAEHNARQHGTDVAQEYAAWEREIPMRRLGEPNEFAAVVAFLASERASFITGTSIAVDGGWIRSLL